MRVQSQCVDRTQVELFVETLASPRRNLKDVGALSRYTSMVRLWVAHKQHTTVTIQ